MKKTIPLMLIVIGLLILITIIMMSCSSGDKGTEPSNSPPQISSIKIEMGGAQLSDSITNTIPAGQKLKLSVTASDPDQDALSCTWNSDYGSFDRNDSTHVEWTAPESSVLSKISVRISDGKASVSDTIKFDVQYSSSLQDGTVSPGSGSIGDLFTFEVVFTDVTDNNPKTSNVVIDGETFSMTKSSGNISSGAKYQYQANLSAGQHTYYFMFKDNRDTTITFPANAYKTGPIVSSDPEISIDENVSVIDELDSVSFSSCTAPH